MGYAFISYSTVNQSAADSVRELFGRNGIDTWMAPYNIPAGSEYAEVLYDALVGCSCLVLMLTSNSQNSVWVRKEVNIAITNGKTVIPLKLEDVELNSSMKLYLNDQQIVPVSVIDGNSEEMRKVLNSVRAHTGTSEAVAAKYRAAAHDGTGPSARIDTHTAPKTENVDPWECYRRGYRFELGEGTPVDHASAAYWYERGAVQGNAWCQHRMGEFCLFGLAMPVDHKKAVQWYTLSAEQNDPSSCSRLAECYENGWGVERNPYLASFWRNKAQSSK